MRLQIELRMAGSAFETDEVRLKDGNEVSRILRNLSNYFEGELIGIGEYPLMDINGNKCGIAKITG